MRRIIMMILRNLFYVPGVWLKLCKYAKNPDNYSEEERYALLRYIDERANIGGNVTIEAHGTENIPKEDGFIFFPNHQGMYDVLAIIAICAKPFTVVMKKELMNIPLLDKILQCNKALAIDRDDVRQSMRVIQQMTADVKEGRNYLIFAEGTRTKNPNKMGEMKGGSFKAATKAKCPIVPVALIDSYKPFDTKSLAQQKVQVHILEPLYYDEYKDMKTTEIAQLVQSRIEKVIAENE